MISLPFDPIKRAQEIETIVMQDTKRKYHRFRPAPYYGGIATADAVGCCFLCAYCWSYFRILQPQKHGKFYSPEAVGDNLLNIAKKKGFKYVRVTGCEPILGERSLEHLVKIIDRTLQTKKDLTFILETNGLLLGFYPDFIERLAIPRLSIRVALKGWDPASFQEITGAEKDYFVYPIIGIKKMLQKGLDAWPAVMFDVFGEEGVNSLKTQMQKQGLKCRMETEVLEKYPYVMDNIYKRGLILKQ
jgi:uncharacterized Fe-S cluster-containing radical SAM superfamily protein